MSRVPVNRVTVEPTLEPVTVSQVKDNAYIISDTSWDSYIREQLIPQARRYVEELTKRALITQTRAQYHDHLDTEIFLRYGPVQSVTSVTYKDSNEASQTLTSTLYTVDTQSYPGRIVQGYDETYPTAITDTNSVVVTYVAGYGSTVLTVPVIYRRAIIMLATHWFHNRASFACGDADAATLKALETLLSIEGRTVEYA